MAIRSIPREYFANWGHIGVEGVTDCQFPSKRIQLVCMVGLCAVQRVLHFVFKERNPRSIVFGGSDYTTIILLSAFHDLVNN